MEELVELLKDGRSRTCEMLASELNTTVEKIERDIEFLERNGIIKRIDFAGAGNDKHSCNGCTGCTAGGKACKACMPEGGFKNMGIMWEVADCKKREK